ncbi:Coatomer subunit beta'-3 [Zea mays]|uniref:Coatomer subunit beta'-3 n=1 Tax=Zea mays TaxID=4577 RepID=A0A1D6JF70_MAIZE|nr:Coatomer subunit beta'-3 [Zea mays]
MTVVTSIDGHPTKTWIVMTYKGGKVSVWDYQEKKTVMELKVNEESGKIARIAHGISQNFKETGVPHSVCSAKFIAQGKWLVVGNSDGYIYVYTYTDTKLKEAKKFRAHDNSVDVLAVHPTEAYLLSSSAYGKTIKLWSLGR